MTPREHRRYLALNAAMVALTVAFWTVAMPALLDHLLG